MARTSPQHYAMCIEGCLDPERTVWFEGLQVIVSPTAPGRTTFVGSVRDQAELHGHISKIRDLCLDLIFVQRIDAEPGDEHTME